MCLLHLPLSSEQSGQRLFECGASTTRGLHLNLRLLAVSPGSIDSLLGKDKEGRETEQPRGSSKNVVSKEKKNKYNSERQDSDVPAIFSNVDREKAQAER